MIDGQMSIYDFLQNDDIDDINVISEEDMVKRVSRATGIDFQYIDSFLGV